MSSVLTFDLEKYEKQRRTPLEVIDYFSPSHIIPFSLADPEEISTEMLQQQLRKHRDPLLDSGCQWELQKLLQELPMHQSPKVTAFGVSPPIRSGRNGGGAQNPLTSDPSWTTLVPTFTRRNLQAIRNMERQNVNSVDDLEQLFHTNQLPLTPVPKETNGEIEECPFACEVKYFDPAASTKHDG
eukprot:g1467.t1